MAVPDPRPTLDDDIAAEWAETCEAYRHAAGHTGMQARAIAHADVLLDTWLEEHPAATPQRASA